MEPELKVDPNRTQYHESTGIFIRAKLDGKWGSYDIAELDKPSLQAFLRGRGGDNPWAEDVVAIMMGHGHFNPVTQ